ncbi:RidA family protein [Shouchella sp. 1P09AA]|uniref:RidA family protein n=1 Tax=unclassified Shouchella TaxID=2893065 RepID=UPI0039A022D0
MKINRNPQTVHPPVAPYVHQVEIAEPCRWLTLSGQLGMALDGSVPEEPIDQLKLALENVKLNLEEASMGVEDLTKLVFYLVGEFNSESRREVINQFLGEHLPCTTMMYVVALAAPPFKVEIDAWAAQPIHE